jgi:hypothetical protein
MKVKLQAFETSARSKLTLSFTLQPIRIRKKTSLPTRQMNGWGRGDQTLHKFPRREDNHGRPVGTFTE